MLPTVLRRALLVSMALAIVVPSLGCGNNADKPPSLAGADPDALPDAVVAAWTKAGATVGWMRANRHGDPEFRVGDEAREGEVPAFQFTKWTPGIVRILPQPQKPFGLSLRDTLIPDGGVMELPGLHHL